MLGRESIHTGIHPPQATPAATRRGNMGKIILSVYTFWIQHHRFRSYLVECHQLGSSTCVQNISRRYEAVSVLWTWVFLVVFMRISGRF